MVALGDPLYKSFRAVGIHPNRGSKIISGLVNVTDEEKEKLAKLVDLPVDVLFPEIQDPDHVQDCVDLMETV